MTFQQLQYLLAIHRTGSVSQAAKELFVTQSSVSIALASLEKELNCRIFVRSTQGLTLTPEGRQVIGHAQRIVESHRIRLIVGFNSILSYFKVWNLTFYIIIGQTKFFQILP